MNANRLKVFCSLGSARLFLAWHDLSRRFFRRSEGRAVLLIGLPGSGKSTLARQRFAGTGAEIHATDAIRGELYGDDAIQGPWLPIETILKARVARSLRAGRTAIIDATHANAQHRRSAIAWIRALGASRVEGLYVCVPPDVCHVRNRSRARVVPDFVIDGMHRTLCETPPTRDEGFDDLVVVENQ